MLQPSVAAEWLKQDMALEELAKRYPNIAVVFLPASSPVLNPIERLWRRIKTWIRRWNGALSMDQIETVIKFFFCCSRMTRRETVAWASGGRDRWIRLSALYRKYLCHEELAIESVGERIVPPYEEKLLRMEKKHALKPVPTSSIADHFGALTVSDLDPLRRYLHDINFLRIVRHN